jgi:hypothetical protein
MKGGDSMAKDHGSSIKDDEQYEALRKKGMSKNKAARIANTSRSKTAKRGGKSQRYDDWSKKDLMDKAGRWASRAGLVWERVSS